MSHNKLFACPSSDNPTITLRKGNVVLKIPNSAAIIRKIDELYPEDKYSYWKRKKDISDEEKNKQRRWMAAAQTWFRQEVFGGTGDFEVVVEEETKPQVESQREVEDTEKYFKPNPEYQPEPKSVVQTTNKNAYEIRLDVLKEALAFIQWKTEVGKNPNIVMPAENVPTSESVINLAQQFYKFVENKR